MHGVPNEDKLPQLHAITYRRNYIFNSIKELPKSKVTKDFIKEHSQTIKEAKDKLLAVLKMIFAGDKLAAEFAFLGLISRVYKRETGLLIGGVQPNISGISKQRAQLFSNFVEAVMPFVSILKSTTDALSNMVFSSKKNYDTNIMEQGYLATLTPGTVLIVDETNMQPGKIINNGVKNIKALATLIEEQAVEMDFQYY